MVEDKENTIQMQQQQKVIKLFKIIFFCCWIKYRILSLFSLRTINLNKKQAELWVHQPEGKNGCLLKLFNRVLKLFQNTLNSKIDHSKSSKTKQQAKTVIF